MKSAFTTLQQRVSRLTTVSRLMAAMLCMLAATTSYADVVQPNASTTNGYVLSGTSEILVEVQFESSTMEYADLISFTTNGSDITLGHGTTNSPSPYIDCGLDRGDETTMSGIGWMRPGFLTGGSGCGAFRAGETHVFPLTVTSTGTAGTLIVITVNIIGDGNGESAPSQATATLALQPISCEIENCPTELTGRAEDNGFATINVPTITTVGSCNSVIQDFSGDYPAGTHTIEVVANTNPEVSCSFDIVVTDQLPPTITGCDNEVIQLGSGECAAQVNKTLLVGDNGNDIPVTISQNNSNTIDLGVSCPGGITTVSRVFDTDDYEIDTELEISSIEFAILEASGGQTVTATVYTVEGSYPGGTLTEVASGSRNVAAGFEFYEQIAIDATIPAGSSFVVELSTEGSLFGGPIFGTSFDGETGTSYVQAPFCNINSPWAFETANYPGQALIMNITGTEKDVIVRQTGDMTFSLGDEFPIGNYVLSYEAVDASGNTEECSFSIRVIEFANPVGSITCNDQVNVSLAVDCRDTITPDQVLEGDMYGCFDDFIVEIEDDFGRPLGNVVDASMINMNLKVRVIGPNGNSCWGRLLIEDKGVSELVCDTVYTTCTGSLEPGSPIAERVTFPATITDGTIADSAPSSTDYEVDVFGLVGSTITDVNVVLSIDHTNVSDLAATLKAPDGTTVALFTNPGGTCDGDNVQLTIDDDAMMSYAELQSTCELTVPTITGQFQSENGNLNAFNGKDPNGTWTISVSDVSNTEGGTVQNLNIVFEQSGGTVVFPTRNAVSFTPTGVNQYDVTGIDACGPVTATYTDDPEDQPCTSQYSQIIRRTWNTEDDQGNQSAPCTQIIYVFRNDLSTLEFPMHFDGVDGRPTLSCLQYGDIDPDNTVEEIPTSVTGGPTGDFCDNVQILEPVDQVIDVCPKSFKIIRRWKLVEWCSGDVIEYNQIIKIEDANGPDLSCPDDVTISTDQYECYGTHVAIAPQVSNECSDNVTSVVRYLLPDRDGNPDVQFGVYETAKVRQQGSRFLVTELPIGTTRIQWAVTDECGNQSTCTYDVTVRDETPPVAACDEFTVTSLGSDGIAYVKALTFDDHSIDNCSELTYLARKMTDPCNISGTVNFSEEIAFCCDEVGTSVMVEMMVTDASGNSNTCMVEVTIDDKLPPFITECPDDITLNCQADVEDFSVTGEPEFIDNCEVVSVSHRDAGSIDQCGRGTITRTWTVEDAQGLKGSCIQRITLQDLDPFVRSDIRFPRDYDEPQGCASEVSPDVTGRPSINDDICSLTAVDYEDQVFTFVDGSCLKILRTWTVIDWCTYDPNNTGSNNQIPGLYTEIQVIKVQNEIAPEIVEPCNNIEVCSYGACGGPVTLTKSATDDCTPTEDLLWEWSLDIDADGDIDRRGVGNSVTVTLDNGPHEITWLVEDLCGNRDVCRQPFEVVDCKKPTPYCRSSVTTVVMPSSGMIDIWASDYNLYSTDNCTPDEDLQYSFSRNTSDTRRVYSCDQLINGEELFDRLQMYVTDNEGNFDFCDVEIIIQDGVDDVCDEDTSSVGMFTINGTVQMHAGGALGNTNVILHTSIGEQNQVTTGQTGTYTFSSLSPNLDYTVQADKTGGVDDGVSTLDLVLIQRHILAISQFTDPMHMVAADIDDNDRVSGADVVSLRQVILGISDEFPNGQKSWRFVDASSTMDAATALPYDEIIEVNNLTQSVTNQDFKAVKIGDVNESATGNLASSNDLDVRSRNVVTLVIKEDATLSGSTLEVPVYADEAITIAGLQLALRIPNGMTISDIVAGQLDINASDVHIDGSIAKTAYASSTELAVTTEEPLFTLIIEGDVSTDAANLLSIDNDALRAELYDSNLETYDVEMSVRTGLAATLTVEQNMPNPFDGQTVISFFTPLSGDVTLEVTDISGRMIYSNTQHYDDGQHTINFDAEDYGAGGILLYTLSNEQHSVTKRMIAIK